MLFIILCGLHFGDAHHDGDGLVVTLEVLLLTLVAGAMVALIHARRPRTGATSARAVTLRRTTTLRGELWAFPTAGERVPLRC